MDTLTGDLLGLIDKHFDAPTSVLLGISSNIKIFMLGYDDFDYKKNVKWLLYGIKKKNTVVLEFLLKTKQYQTVEHVREFYKHENVRYVFHLAKLQKRIPPPTYASFRMFELRLFIKQTIKDHWWDGTVCIYNLIKDENRYDYNDDEEDLMCIIRFAYKYGYLEALQLVNLHSPKDELFGMIKSKIDYGDQLLSVYNQYIGTGDPMLKSAKFLCRILGINRDLSFLLENFGGQISILIDYLIRSKLDHSRKILKCFVRAIRHSNIVVANAIYDGYCALYNEGSPIKRVKQVADVYRETVACMINLSVVGNVPSVYEKHFGQVDNPLQRFYRQLSDSHKQYEFIREMLDYGNYKVFTI